MAAMNRSEVGAGGANPGANLNLDDDSLFAELDSEVMAGGEPGGGDLDFDLDLGGESAPAAEAADELDLDLGGESLAGGDDLDLDLGGDTAGGSGGDDGLDLDMGGGDAGMGDLDLDAGGTGSMAEEEAAPADDAMGDLDLDLDTGGGDAGMGDMDLDLGGAEVAPGDDLDLDLGAPAAAAEEADLDLDVSPAMEAPLEESMVADLGDVDLDLEPIPEELAAGGGAADADLGLESFSIEPMDLPDEPVFDISAAPKADAEFHAAPDVPLDDEAVSLELQDVDMEPIEDEPHAAEDMIALEPAMRADNAVDLGPMAAAPAAMAAAAEEFVAVPDATLADEDLLELNLDDLDAVPSAEQAPMMQTPSQGARQSTLVLEKAIPAAEQLEIPPETGTMDFPPMEPLPDFDDMDALGPAPMAAQMARPAPAQAVSPAAVPRPLPAAQPVAAAQTPVQIGGNLIGNDILMAVSHQISVQLGSLSLNGKELMDISYGSVLPLERVIGEPVDLVLENKTIAQAEVVLINGKNLGVRIVALNR